MWEFWMGTCQFFAVMYGLGTIVAIAFAIASILESDNASQRYDAYRFSPLALVWPGVLAWAVIDDFREAKKGATEHEAEKLIAQCDRLLAEQAKADILRARAEAARAKVIDLGKRAAS